MAEDPHDPVGVPERYVDCPACNGTGTRVDVGAIARRYGGSGDARVARFGVKP
jgi:hypothetical protein